MSNETKRTYTASEVREIIELLRDDPDMSAEKFSGMEALADILTYFEDKTDADIEAQVKATYRGSLSPL